MRQGIGVVARVVVVVVIALMGVEAAGGGVCLDWRRAAHRCARWRRGFGRHDNDNGEEDEEAETWLRIEKRRENTDREKCVHAKLEWRGRKQVSGNPEC